MIDVARVALAVKARQLRELLDISRQRLAPLNDPLDVDLGRHRWLAADREEAYSDWLQWVLQQLRHPERVFRLFNLTLPSDWAAWSGVTPEIHREYSVGEGHPGRTGRLDIVVDYAGHARIIVEVKKTEAELSDTAKGAGYERSQKSGTLSGTPCWRILLATAGAQSAYPGNFSLLPWSDFCVSLRRLVAELGSRTLPEHEKVPLLARAMMLAFVAAVEQNLLGFSAEQVREIVFDRLTLFNAQIVDHLREAVDLPSRGGSKI
jgi:hypothetical protein